jgi:hypothetical protein
VAGGGVSGCSTRTGCVAGVAGAAAAVLAGTFWVVPDGSVAGCFIWCSIALAIRCNCQMSFSSSFERPRFKLRSNKKRIDNTKTIGRPMARVASTTVTSSSSGDGREWIIALAMGWVQWRPPQVHLGYLVFSFFSIVLASSFRPRLVEFAFFFFVRTFFIRYSLYKSTACYTKQHQQPFRVLR